MNRPTSPWQWCWMPIAVYPSSRWGYSYFLMVHIPSIPSRRREPQPEYDGCAW